MKKGLIIALAILVCLSGIVHTVRENQNTTIAQHLDREKLKSESLLAEKLGIEKVLMKSKQTVNRLNEQHLSVDQERARLATDISRQEESIEWSERRYMRILRDKQMLGHVVDSLRMRIRIIEEEKKREKTQLLDSITFLNELSQTLSAELSGRQNQ